jgi:DNA polymerase III delta prime subunit
MSSRRSLAILIGIILIVSGIVFFFGIPGIFEVEKTPDNIWGIILLVGGSLITLFAALNEATEFIQKLFSRERKDLLNRDRPYDIQGPSNLQNRLNVIANVRQAWIKGVLENNLQDAVRLELDLQEIPDVLMRPNIRLRYQTNSDRAISPDVSIFQIFQESSQNLLILGAPGSGKTFTMLELARDLLDEAERSEHTSVPIILNLSSWAKERPLLKDWMADEIHLQYQLAKRVTYAWLEHDQICLLLDGLDEVNQEQREACVEAINAFRLQYNNPIVVCSRTGDYTQLAVRLNLSRAIEIQPLKGAQVEEYLSKPALQLQAVRATLQHDPELRELAITPLFLSIITIAYRGLGAEELGMLETKEVRRRHLFNAYISRMFQHRPLPKQSPYTARRATIGLAYLARELVQRSEATFFLERLQMDWLPRSNEHTYHHYFVLFFGLTGGLIAGLLAGLFLGLFFGLVFGLFSGLVVGLVAGLGFGFTGWRQFQDPIYPVDEVQFNFPGGRELVSGLVFGLFGGLVVGLINWLFSGLFFGLITGPIFGLVTGLIFGFDVGLFYILDDILRSVESQHRIKPSQGIRRSLKNTVYYLMAYWLVLGLGIGLVFGLSFGLGLGLVGGPAIGLAVALVGVIISRAGQTTTRHYFLRWALHREGLLPLILVPVLDAMSERLLLRRVGSGYIFIHRTLMEHFASLSEEELDELADRING